MKKIILLLFLCVLVSCVDNKKKYLYVEIVDSLDLNNEVKRIEKIDTIEQYNDSSAAVSAYRLFCLHKKMDKDYAEKNITDFFKTVDYKLLNDKNEFVLAGKYLSKEIKNQISKEIFSEKSSLDFLDEKKSNVNEKMNTSYINSDESANPCIISEDFIKQDLYNPSTVDFSNFDCSTEKNSDGTYTILRKVSAENSFGVEREYVYKLTVGFRGGDWVDMSNWTLINIQSEEYR